MRVKPGEATYKILDDGTIKWNVKNKELPELARYWYLQCAGLDGTICKWKQEVRRLQEEIKKLKKRKKRK